MSALIKPCLLLLLCISTSLYAGPNARSPFGINSNDVIDFDASIPFIDVFKSSLPFEEARPWLTKGKIDYDVNGWPKNLNGGQVGTRFLYKLPKEAVPEGNYTVLYDGEGVMQYTDDAKLVKREPGKDIINITAGKDDEFRVKLLIKHSNPANYLRNVRVLIPGGVCANNHFKRVAHKNHCRGSKYLPFEKYHQQLVFNPDYLEYMRDFKVIRFMNMSGITRNPITTWEQRNKPEKATWAGKSGVRGAPLEVMVRLANLLNADPWFTIPHKADNNFVRRHAHYVKNNLKPGLKAYVEYTNEAWNTIFSQAIYMKDMGERLGLDTDRDKGGYKYYSQRSVQIFDMWEQAFGGTDRLVRVMGSWTGYSRLSEMLLTYRNAYKKTDALAIAPYFYINHKNSKKVRSVSEIFQKLYDPKEAYSIPNVAKLVKKHTAVTDKLGIDLIAYEGGQHLVDWSSRNIKSHPTHLFIEANRHWRMAKAYKDFMKGWREAGGKLFVNFSAPRTYQWFGSWGTKEYITQPDHKAPKHRALMEFARQNPCWWKNCTASKLARFDKPAHNPLGDIFALVPSKDKNGKIIKTASTAKTSVIGTKVPVATTKTIAKAQQPPKPKNQQALNTTVAAISPDDLPIWEKKLIEKIIREDIPHINESYNRQLAKQSQQQAIIKPLPKLVKLPPHDAVVHRVSDRKNIWRSDKAIHMSNLLGGNVNGRNDLSASWQSHWDHEFLYVKVETTDDKFIRDSSRPWGDDSIELYIDADGSRSAQYDGRNDFHLIYRWKDYRVNLSRNSPRRRDMGIQQTMTRTDKGYTLETAIPWRTLGVKPVAGNMIGIDVQINDDDNGKDRDAKLSWHARQDASWKTPRNFGRLVLGI